MRWLARLPMATSLHGYRRAWLAADALAGVTLLVIAVPEQLATSRLAQMPAVTALWAFVAASLAFALLGSNPQLSVGADSTIAPLFAAGVTHFASSTTNASQYIAMVSTTALLTGAAVAAIGIFRLGWIADFLSAPIITGFLAGVAVIILTHQLPDLLGVKGGSGSTAHRFQQVWDELSKTNGWALGLGLGVLAVIVVAERVNRRVPGALIGLVGATVIVGAAHLTAHGVPVLGHVAGGLPKIGAPGVTWKQVGQLVPIALTVALVCLGQSAATTRAFAAEGGYDVDVDRDFIGVGAANVLAGFAGTFPVNASPARTGIVAHAGGRTQMAGLIAAAGVIAVVPATGALKDVPLAALAGILLFVASRLLHLPDLRAIFRFDKWEFGLTMVTFLAVALVGVEQGIGVAVALAIIDRTRLSARPRMIRLGHIAGTTSWGPLDGPERTEPVPGVTVLLFAGPLYFANAGDFRKQALAAVERPGAVVQAVVLDAAGMGDIDYTGVAALRTVIHELEQKGAAFAIARAGGDVPENLRRSGLLADIGANRLFETVDEAVRAVTAGGAAPNGHS